MFAAAVATLTQCVDALADIDPAGLGIAEQLGLLDVLETTRRRLTAVSHTVALAAAKSDAPTVMAKAIADAIRVSPAEVRRRLRDAEQLAPRSTLTGEPLPALMPSTALGWHAGDLDGEHVRVIQSSCATCPQTSPLTWSPTAKHSWPPTPSSCPRPTRQARRAVGDAGQPDGRFSDGTAPVNGASPGPVVSVPTA